MNPISVNFGLFGLVATFNFVLWILGFACLVQLFRFLTKGIKALDIFITENKFNNKVETTESQNDLER